MDIDLGSLAVLIGFFSAGFATCVYLKEKNKPDIIEELEANCDVADALHDEGLASLSRIRTVESIVSPPIKIKTRNYQSYYCNCKFFDINTKRCSAKTNHGARCKLVQSH